VWNYYVHSPNTPSWHSAQLKTHGDNFPFTLLYFTFLYFTFPFLNFAATPFFLPTMASTPSLTNPTIFSLDNLYFQKSVTNAENTSSVPAFPFIQISSTGFFTLEALINTSNENMKLHDICNVYAVIKCNQICYKNLNFSLS